MGGGVGDTGGDAKNATAAGAAPSPPLLLGPSARPPSAVRVVDVHNVKAHHYHHTSLDSTLLLLHAHKHVQMKKDE